MFAINSRYHGLAQRQWTLPDGQVVVYLAQLIDHCRCHLFRRTFERNRAGETPVGILLQRRCASDEYRSLEGKRLQ